ncbi:MAG TPA: Uma2 family endonuclease [Saprospiraceae bacterium]|nr:Uma2 family endonuclease [Saprospiraceae bacterium]HMQ84919.1 Uma2 family endonuclease [Saprospiraceae bacterium]
MSSSLLHRLLDSPDASLLIQQANACLEEEAARRSEFREWVSPAVKAEFINGKVMLHSPVKRRHLQSSGNLYKLLDTYVILHQLGTTSYDKGMIALSRNDYEPDICFWGSEKSVAFHEDTMLHPAPDLVVEVLSRKTAKIDRTIKYKDYAAHGIAEYWIIDPQKKIVEQYWLQTIPENTYALVAKWSSGDRINARAVPGFSIPVEAIFDNQAFLQTMKALVVS